MTTDAPAGFDRECGPGGLEARAVPAAVGLAARDASTDDSTTAPVIEGYGSVSESPTRIEGAFSEWDEEVAAGAWATSIRAGDVMSMHNHDTNLVLGSTKAGTLRLSEDSTGLRYSVDINPDDPLAMSTHAKVARGDVDGSSVWFQVVRQEWTYPTDGNGLEVPKRRILEGALIETGPVTFPAFPQTTATARSLAPLDAVLRAGGMTNALRRARLASDLIADPAALEAELRSLFGRLPDLEQRVCSCSGRAAAPAPEPQAAAPTPEPTALSLAAYRARLDLMRRQTPA